jgi:hypothetical protein
MDIKSIAPIAIAYDSYRYLWSPRPAKQTPPENLPAFDNNTLIAQPKLNGSNTLIFMNDAGFVKVMNRHQQEKTGDIKIDFANLYRGAGWMVLNGEWMEKSKLDESKKNFNGNYVIFELLVYNSFILCGSTLMSRLLLLNDLYGSDTFTVNTDGSLHGKEYLYTTNLSNVYRTASYENNFKDLYDELTPIDMVEGLVLKSRSATLTPPFVESANQSWQLKCRKPSKIYKF